MEIETIAICEEEGNNSLENEENRENEKSVESVSDQIKSVLDKLPPEERSTSIDEQNEALDSLGQDFIIGLKAHIYSAIKTEGDREKEGKPNKMDDFRNNPERFIKGHLKGEIFEKLVVMDPVIRSERFKGVDPKKVAEMEALSNEILSVMQNPARYNLEDRIQLRRLPDATYIDITDAGYVEILGVGEAKSGRIDKRFRSQALGYEESVKIVSEGLSKIRHPKRLRNLGLNHLADRMEKAGMSGVSNFVRVAPDFKETLIIPQDKILDYDWVEDIVDNILRSSFTTYELDAITKWAYEKIQE